MWNIFIKLRTIYLDLTLTVRTFPFFKKWCQHTIKSFQFSNLSLYPISSKVSKSCFWQCPAVCREVPNLLFLVNTIISHMLQSCPINIIIQFIAFISNSVIRFSCSHYFNDQSCNSESLNHSRFSVSGHLLCFILNLVSNFAVGCIHCGIRRSVGNQSN